MKASELRIGNYVLLDDKGVYQIDSGHDIDEIDSFPLDDNYCQGIPLTEQWLLDFGFIKGERYFKAKEYGEEGIFTAMCYDLRRKEFIVNSNNYDSYIVECVYVHQLQNLFFALTDEELIKK